MGLTQAQEKEYELVLEKFDNYFKPAKNTVHEVAVLNQRFQRPGESVESFIRSPCELAEICEFEAKKNENITNRTIAGILDKDLSVELQTTPDLILETGIKRVCQSELVESQIAVQAEPWKLQTM